MWMSSVAVALLIVSLLCTTPLCTHMLFRFPPRAHRVSVVIVIELSLVWTPNILWGVMTVCSTCPYIVRFLCNRAYNILVRFPLALIISFYASCVPPHCVLTSCSGSPTRTSWRLSLPSSPSESFSSTRSTCTTSQEYMQRCGVTSSE